MIVVYETGPSALPKRTMFFEISLFLFLSPYWCFAFAAVSSSFLLAWTHPCGCGVVSEKLRWRVGYRVLSSHQGSHMEESAQVKMYAYNLHSIYIIIYYYIYIYVHIHVSSGCRRHTPYRGSGFFDQEGLRYSLKVIQQRNCEDDQTKMVLVNSIEGATCNQHLERCKGLSKSPAWSPGPYFWRTRVWHILFIIINSLCFKMSQKYLAVFFSLERGVSDT